MNGPTPCRTCGYPIAPRHVDECPPATLAAARAEWRGPTDLEATGEYAAAALEALPEDGSGLYLEPLAVYRYAEGGDLPAMLVCGECLRLAGEALDTRAVGARTAGTCTACGRSGAPARWSEALRGAAYWRALVLAFEPEREAHRLPGMRSDWAPWAADARAAAARWVTILRAADDERRARDGEPPDATLRADDLRAAIRAAVPSAVITIAQTGGGTATMYVFVPGEMRGTEYAVGPGAFDWDNPWGSTFWPGEVTVGLADDDGHGPSASIDTAADAAEWIARG